jgi:chromosome segregation ATPase
VTHEAHPKDEVKVLRREATELTGEIESSRNEIAQAQNRIDVLQSEAERMDVLMDKIEDLEKKLQANLEEKNSLQTTSGHIQTQLSAVLHIEAVFAERLARGKIKSH